MHFLIASSLYNLRYHDSQEKYEERTGHKENCKKSEWIMLRKTVSLSLELHIGDVKIRQVPKFNNMDSVITNDGNSDTTI